MTRSTDHDVTVHGHVDADYPDFLRDESRSTGQCDALVFAESEQDVLQALRYAQEQDWPVTVQGARTGITAGAVPRGGLLVNLSRMQAITGMSRDAATGGFEITLQPGVTLAQLNEHIQHKEFDTTGWDEASLESLRAFRDAGPFFFSPDPTEQTAALGGMAACNASGARSFKYGATRGHVRRLRMVMIDGEVLDIRRGAMQAHGRMFHIPAVSGRTYEGTLPGYTSLAIKSAAGYFVRENMDIIDLFIGSEGTLGIITELTVSLLPAPGAIWGVMAFFPSEESAVAFVSRARTGEPGQECKPAAIEFFDHNALSLLRGRRVEHASLPDIPEAWHTAVYVEYDGDNEEEVAGAVESMCEALVACGGSEDAAWMAADHHELQRLKDFRHALPEAVNTLIDERRRADPALTKLGTDMAVPDAHLSEVMRMYHTSLAEAGLEYVIFGHIGNNHVHVNILPRDHDEYDRGKALYLAWAETIIAMGGTVSAEHGIGKLKTPFLQRMFGTRGIEEMKALKRVFDPRGRLNPGNLFEP